MSTVRHKHSACASLNSPAFSAGCENSHHHPPNICQIGVKKPLQAPVNASKGDDVANLATARYGLLKVRQIDALKGYYANCCTQSAS